MLLSHMHSTFWTYSMKNDFISVSLLPFTKKSGRSSYGVTMTHCYDIPMSFLFKFVANAQDLYWDNFLVLPFNRRGVMRIYYDVIMILFLFRFVANAQGSLAFKLNQ